MTRLCTTLHDYLFNVTFPPKEGKTLTRFLSLPPHTLLHLCSSLAKLCQLIESPVVNRLFLGLDSNLCPLPFSLLLPLLGTVLETIFS